MTFKEQLAADITDVFVNEDEFAEPIAYRQGVDAPITASGIAHNVVYELLDSNGYATKFNGVDWAIPAAQLTVEPRPGDEIDRTVGSETWTYETLPIDGNSQVAALDPSRLLWTVHSKRIR
jgi:hypothetical protein